ncbi:ZF-HD protein dimerization region containing protein [Musa troglodytarum]|uniref:ZF-HD protein dimerization region containing protein n=1 Tax=Musa troglodytarum TaxID=320322 RepID=A0A9E7I146_9LILI|nr:ZF-HD protein dimerization region containing protein [Musa troglodytarum]
MSHDTSPLHHRSSGSPPPPAAAAAAAPPPLSAATTEDHHHSTNPYSTKKGLVVKYRECLKNHAAAIGGNATDGCGEFMPSGEEGTLEALKCSACNCHRNFHRKEAEGESSYDCYHPFKGRKAIGQRGLLISGIMPLGAMQTSESDEIEGAGGGMMARPPLVKKRFRTKFTAEQKEKMLHFAEKVGWRFQKQEESAVQQFCQEIGVKRRVLKVWMHNNKHNLAKKGPLQLE